MIALRRKEGINKQIELLVKGKDVWTGHVFVVNQQKRLETPFVIGYTQLSLPPVRTFLIMTFTLVMRSGRSGSLHTRPWLL